MKITILSCVLLLSFLHSAKADANGGTTCAGCSILVGLGFHLAQVHSTDIVTAVENFLCAKLTSPFDEACRRLLDEFGPILIDGIYHRQTPDMICHDIGLCKQDPGKDFCHLFPLPAGSNYTSPYQRRQSAVLTSHRVVKHLSHKGVEDYPVCSLPGVKKICEIIERFADDHLPIQDKDEDRFSTHPTFRGTHWRGKDCEDSRSDVYPGRKPINDDREFDSNCNGIYGVDPHTNEPYEKLYCSDFAHKGIAILGDSAGAHFHIPAEYFMAANYDDHTFDDILTILSNEFDWPQLSSVTAFSTNKWENSIAGPIDSLYLRMLDNNRCMHRDYQNIAVNGARSGNMDDTMLGLARNSSLDFPIVVVLALVGNDVCNGKVDTVASMTTPNEYRTNMMKILGFLNSTLPRGSTVLISGLADGRVLWDTMSERIHPLGQLNSDIQYKNLYDYLNCLEVSPCTGWMNSNGTLRNLTSQRAAELSAVAKDITVSANFSMIDLIYTDFEVQRMMDLWESQGGQDWQVIEPVDGFHPSQVGQALSSQFMYDLLTTNYPQVLGKKNPYNAKIKEVFGEQGGY